MQFLGILLASFMFVSLVYAADAPVAVQAHRLSAQPLLKPGLSWASAGVFNPAAIRIGGKTVLLFRAVDGKGTSRIGYAEGTDGLHFTQRPDPVLEPSVAYELGGGVEDPRLVRIGGLYYMTYTGYNRKDAQLCMATSRDLLHWERRGVVMPAYKGNWNVGWTKSGAIIPERINGKWWMYYMGTRKDADGTSRDYMGIASSDDLLHWSDATGAPVLARRPGAFDSRVMEPGPAPIVTSAGILLFYNGASETLVYGPAWVLFDRQDPTRMIARAEAPFLVPELEWERKGVVPNVIFLEGAIIRSLTRTRMEVTGYYGGADKFVGSVSIRVLLTPATLR